MLGPEGSGVGGVWSWQQSTAASGASLEFATLAPGLGAVAQSGSAPRSHRGGQGFKSPQLHAFPQVRVSVESLCGELKDRLSLRCHRDQAKADGTEQAR